MKQNANTVTIAGQGRLPFVTVQIPDHESLNARLREKIIHMSETIPDVVSNLKSGQSFFANKWLSKSNLHLSDDPDFLAVAHFAREMTKHLTQVAQGKSELEVTSMWCMVSRSGLTGRPHNHKGLISAAYYVDPGSSGNEHGGELLFFAQPQRAGRPTHCMTPKAGCLLLFPSYLFHAVSNYRSTTPRIVISVNLS
ncbi:MAG: 2OG-Fe(II) oxygenase [Proteobacteria bacterium]|nr:2OG-Fe(II) oxygenase [Pseudomonadota bacterium]